MEQLNQPRFSGDHVRETFEALTDAERDYALQLRALAFQAAQADPRIGPITESLKWSEPSYAPATRGVGTAVRIGKLGDGNLALLVHCQTTLVSHWREVLPHLTYSGTRAIVLDPREPVPAAELEQCMADAFTYKLRKA